MKGSEFSSCKDHWWKRASTGMSVLRLLGQAPPELEMPGLWRRGLPVFVFFFCHIGDAPGFFPESLGRGLLPGLGPKARCPFVSLQKRPEEPAGAEVDPHRGAGRVRSPGQVNWGIVRIPIILVSPGCCAFFVFFLFGCFNN